MDQSRTSVQVTTLNSISPLSALVISHEIYSYENLTICPACPHEYVVR